MKSFYPILCFSLMIFPASLKAQFHQKSENSQSTAPRQMTKAMVPGYNGMGLSNRKIKSEGAFLAPTQTANGAGSHVKVQIERKMPKDIAVWGRAENHPDGTYTKTVSDINNVQVDNMIVQETRKKTFSGDDPLVLVRKISLNVMGNPDEVMIFDGRGNYKYRGKFVYDNWSRVKEQMLWSSRGELLRRTIQEYDQHGEPKPLKNCDYVKDVPADLQLIVSQTNPQEQEMLDKIGALYENKKRKGLLSGYKNRQADIKAAEIQEQMNQQRYGAQAPVQPNVQSRPAATAAPAEIGGKKKPFFRFGRKKDK